LTGGKVDQFKSLVLVDDFPDSLSFDLGSLCREPIRFCIGDAVNSSVGLGFNLKRQRTRVRQRYASTEAFPVYSPSAVGPKSVFALWPALNSLLENP